MPSHTEAERRKRRSDKSSNSTNIGEDAPMTEPASTEIKRDGQKEKMNVKKAAD